MAKRPALGKGLGALFPDRELERKGDIHTINIRSIRPSPLQPRKQLPDEGIEELARSIREKGILQPLVVRKKQDGYEIVMGERRWRAAQRAGLHEVPIIVRDASDRDVMEMTLIENLQREDLTPVEEAYAYQRMITEFSYTQEALAQRIGKDRSSVANTLRLLRLPDEIKNALETNKISTGHARALLSVKDQRDQIILCEKIVEKGLSVRQTEEAVRRLLQPAPAKESPRVESSPEIEALRDQLRHLLKTQVRIKVTGGKGSIEIEFYSLDDLERILHAIGLAQGLDSTAM